MKILIYVSTPLLAVHLGYELEIAKQHIKKGDDVYFLVCDKSMLSCDLNENHDSFSCDYCVLRLEHGLDLINFDKSKVYKLELSKFIKYFDIPNFESVQELKKFEYDNLDVGSCTASIMITGYRDCEFDLNSKFAKIRCRNSIYTAYAIYQSVLYHLKKINPDIFYVHNARTSIKRPALRSGQKLGIKTICFDSGYKINQIKLIENTYMHDIKVNKKHIKDFWENAKYTFNEKKEIARKFYLEQKENNFTKNFIYKLPDNFDKSKTNIAIFNSSEDEMESIDSWKDTFYNRQIEVISYLVNNYPQINFYLRVHPNLKDLNNSQTKAIDKLKYDNLVIINANSKLSSYKLLDNCNKIVTFGSTIGIEANYYNKPSILVGRSFYEHLNVCYVAKSYNDLDKFITSDLIPKPKLGSYKYAYWQVKNNIDLEYWKSNDAICNGSFDGQSMQPNKKDILLLRQ